MAPPSVFLWHFTSFPNRVLACPSQDGVSLLLYNSDRISDWAACSTVPRRAGQPGLSSVSLWETASHPSLPVFCLVFLKPTYFHLNFHKIKMRRLAYDFRLRPLFVL